MNEVTRIKEEILTPDAGQIYERNFDMYLLGEFNNKYFLVNLATGSTWNGFKDNINDLFSKKDFKLVADPILLTPQ